MTIEDLIKKGSVTKINDSYMYVSYNGVDVYMTSDKEWFNASKLLKSFKSVVHDDGSEKHKQTFNGWFNGSTIKSYFIENPDIVKDIQGAGTQKYKGKYLPVYMFQFVLGALDFSKCLSWWQGNINWSYVNVEGYVYMIQTKDLIDTSIVKVGETVDYKSRFRGYSKQKQTMYILCIAKVYDRCKAERAIKNYLCRHVINVSELGAEYYECNDIDEAYELFKDSLKGVQLIGKPNVYKYGSKTYDGTDNFKL